MKMLKRLVLRKRRMPTMTKMKRRAVTTMRLIRCSRLIRLWALQKPLQRIQTSDRLMMKLSFRLKRARQAIPFPMTLKTIVMVSRTQTNMAVKTLVKRMISRM